MSRPFSLDELMMFHAVVSAGSLSRASLELGIATSTLSRHLSRLEQQMGMLLLKRNTRGIVPTEVGMELLDRCAAIQHEVRLLEDIADTVRTQVSGTLRVSIPSEFGSSWLGAAISEFALQHPALDLVVDIATEPVNPMNNNYDVAIGFGQLPDSQLAVRRLALLQRGLFASPGYLAKHPMPENFADLENHDFIITDVQRREGTLALHDPNTKRRLALTPKVRVNGMRLARELVIHGVGLALLPRAMCQNYVASGTLVPVLTQWHWPPVEATALILSRAGLPKKTRSFLNFITDRLHAMEEDCAQSNPAKTQN